MMNPISRAIPLVLAGLLALPPAAGALTVFSDAGLTPADIQGTVDAFRAALGDPNNGNNPGPLASGRREINWDGGGNPNGSPVGNPFPGFQNRGVIFTTPGTGFLQAPVGGPGDPATNDLFDFFGVDYSSTLQFFSPVRLFVPVDSNVTDGVFSIPGTSGAVPAGTKGFGAVFTDVDVLGSTTIDFFNPANDLISSQVVPALAGDGTLSFLGLLLGPGEGLIARIRITTGNSPLGLADNPPNVDIVAMDDFFFAEPQRIPQPRTLVMLGGGLIAVSAVALVARRVGRRRKDR